MAQTISECKSSFKRLQKRYKKRANNLGLYKNQSTDVEMILNSFIEDFDVHMKSKDSTIVKVRHLNEICTEMNELVELMHHSEYSLMMKLSFMDTIKHIANE